MPHYYDLEEADERREPELPSTSCRRCGQGGLHWRQVTSADGRSEINRLFDEKIRRHVCAPSADDFGIVGA